MMARAPLAAQLPAPAKFAAVTPAAKATVTPDAPARGTAGGRKGKARATGSGGGMIWLQGLACGGLVTLAPATAILGVLLLAPLGLVMLLDGMEQRAAARPVLLWGIAGSLHPMVALWSGGDTVGQAMALAGELPVMATAWAAQAAGWLFAELLPLLITMGMNTKAAALDARLRKARARYESEWDIKPAAAPDNPVSSGSPAR